MRRFGPILVILVLAALLAPAGPAGAQPYWNEPTFSVRESIEQITVYDAEPGQVAGLYRFLPHQIALEPVAEQVIDDFGATVFRSLDAGRGYVVRIEDEIEWQITAQSESWLPAQSLYDEQDLVEGFQYIETRDGTTLSVNVVLPGPIEDGPYPTVVEYSGYDPSNPLSSGLISGLDVTPLCGSLPTLCKAPAQPSSMLAGLMGFAIVGVNVRGTGCSGGSYDFFESMQVADGYDVIETVASQDWVLNNSPGMVGLSYPGISQMWVAQSQPPSLAAIAPVSVYGDTATGVLRPGGLLNTGFAVSWAENVLRNAEPNGTGWVRDLIAAGDTVCDANQDIRLQNVNAADRGRESLYYTDEIAAPLDPRTFVDKIEVPVFLASAFQDEQTGPSFGEIVGEFVNAPVARQVIYNGLHADGFSPQILQEWNAFLDLFVGNERPEIPAPVIGLAPLLSAGIYGGAVAIPEDPWADVATYEEALDIYMNQDPIRVIMERGGETGGLPEGSWDYLTTSWPPPTTEVDRWWFGPEGTLTDTPAQVQHDPVSFVPNPDWGTETYHSGGGIWLADPGFDWRAAPAGETVAFETAPLSEDNVLMGTASVDLYIRSSAADADVEVVISEVRPDGQEMLVQAGMLRASYRAVEPDSTELLPKQIGREAFILPLVPDGAFVPMRVQIPAFAHVFRAGSSIRITVGTPGGDKPQWEFELLGLGSETRHDIGVGLNTPSSVALPLVPFVPVPTTLPPCPSLRGQPCRVAPPIANAKVLLGTAGANDGLANDGAFGADDRLRSNPLVGWND